MHACMGGLGDSAPSQVAGFCAAATIVLQGQLWQPQDPPSLWSGFAFAKQAAESWSAPAPKCPYGAC